MKKSCIKTLLSAALALAGIGLTGAAVQPAAAALVSTSPGCANVGPWPSISPTPVTCIGSFAGADSSQQPDLLPLMSASFVGDTGVGTWTLTETVPGNGSGSAISFAASSAGGPINFASPISGFFSLALNSGGQFSVFLFDGTSTAIGSVHYTTAGVFINSSGRRLDLTEVSLYSFDPGGPGPSEIPLPASGILLGAGLIGTAWLTRRRRQR